MSGQGHTGRVEEGCLVVRLFSHVCVASCLLANPIGLRKMEEGALLNYSNAVFYLKQAGLS